LWTFAGPDFRGGGKDNDKDAMAVVCTWEVITMVSTKQQTRRTVVRYMRNGERSHTHTIPNTHSPKLHPTVVQGEKQKNERALDSTESVRRSE
jgi:hypothetical protein